MKAKWGQAAPTETPRPTWMLVAKTERGRWPGAAVPPESM